MTTEYLTVAELSQRIKYTEQTIYNLICTGTFIEGQHFFKPTPKKILFKWLTVVQWIEGEGNNSKDNCVEENEQTVARCGAVKRGKNPPNSSINI